MNSYKFICGNVAVVVQEYNLEAALVELEKRLSQAASFGVSLPSWLDFELA